MSVEKVEEGSQEDQGDGKDEGDFEGKLKNEYESNDKIVRIIRFTWSNQLLE